MGLEEQIVRASFSFSIIKYRAWCILLSGSIGEADCTSKVVLLTFPLFIHRKARHVLKKF